LQLKHLKDSFGQADNADQWEFNKCEQYKPQFSVLFRSKQDIESMMPPDEIDYSQRPAIMEIKQCLDEMDKLGTKKDEIMKEGSVLLSSFNTSEQLMEVYF